MIWEVIGMFRGGSSPAAPAIEPTATASPSPSAVAAMTPKPTLAPHSLSRRPCCNCPHKRRQGGGHGPAPSNPIAQASPPPAHPLAHVSAEQSRPTPDKTPLSGTFAIEQARQEAVQTRYVSALNELQMLKIQKEMAETNQAIVAAKLATATAEKTITDMLAQPEPQQPQFNMGKNGPGGASSTNVMPPPDVQPDAGPNPMAAKSFSVQSVSMIQDQWHAVIKYKDDLYDVGVGDILPPDGSVIKTIDQNSVTLESAGVTQKIPLTVTDNVPTGSTVSSSDASSASIGTSTAPQAPAPHGNNLIGAPPPSSLPSLPTH